MEIPRMRCFPLELSLRIGFVVAMAMSPATSQGEGLRAGAHAEDITPTFPISLNGGMADRTATHAHDRLHARCLVLDDGKTRFAFVVCDSCVLPRPIMDKAKELANAQSGIPPTNILISATHTHSAPTAASVFQSDPDETYVKELSEDIANGIEKASKNLVPAKIGWGSALEANQVFNRRWKMRPGTIGANPFGKLDERVQMNPPVGSENLLEPAGPIDPQVFVLSAQTLEGKPIAVLANYSLHYVGDVPPNAASADYYGEFANRIEQQLGASGQTPPFVGILSNGTSGDINNINFRTAHAAVPTFGRIRLVADAVANAARIACDSIKFLDTVTIDTRQKELELAVRKPTSAELKRAEEILLAAGDKPLAKLDQIYANETIKLAELPDRVRLIVQVTRFGDLAIVAIPCETFVEIGLRIKKESPFPSTFTISLANGYNGYLPTPEHHELGGYETWRARSSYLETQASPAIEKAVFELLDQLAKAR